MSHPPSTRGHSQDIPSCSVAGFLFRLTPLVADPVLSKTPGEVRETLEGDAGRMRKAQAFEKLKEVRDGPSLIMEAVKSGSVPTVEAVFAAMASSLDDDQVSYVEGRTL